MPKPILEFFLTPSSSEEENRLLSFWLRRIFLVASGILACYIFIALFQRFTTEVYIFIGLYLVVFAGLSLLLRKGYVRLVSLLFCISGICGLVFATYRFGGVRSASYSAMVIVIILSSMFLRGKLTVLTTAVSIITGLFLLIAEVNGYYKPNDVFLTPFSGWFANSLIFIMAATLLGIAARQVRNSMRQAAIEITERRRVENELREKSQYQAALHETALAILNRRELLPLFESILTRAEELANTKHGYIDLLMPENQSFQQIVGHGVFEKLDGIIVPTGQGVGGLVFATGETKLIDNYQVWPDRVQAYVSAGFQTIAAVPLSMGGKVIGIIGLVHTEPERKFSTAQLEILDQLSELATLAMENTRLYQAVQEELTERKRTQEALLRSEENLRLALGAARMGTWDLDVSTNKIVWSDTACHIFGLDKMQAVQSYPDFINLSSPKDHEKIHKAVEKSLKNPATLFSVEHRIVWPDESTHWVESKGQVYLDQNGNPIRMAGTITDITVRKMAEDSIQKANKRLERDTFMLKRRSALLQVASEVSRAVSAILDPSVLSKEVVDIVRKRFGLYYVGLFLVDEQREFAVLQAGTGKAGRELLKNGHKLPIRNTSMVGWSIANQRARIALDVGKDAVHFSNPLLPESRSELSLPLITHGQALGALTIQSNKEAAFSQEDIETFQTMADQLANAILNARLYGQLEKELEERKRAEEEVRHLNAELEERVQSRTQDLQAANREMEAFSYSVSHDLRAPLRAIDGYSRILLEDFHESLSQDSAVHLEKIRWASAQMAQLIDDLLRLSRINRAEMRFDPIDLSMLVQSVVSELQNQNPGRVVSIEITPNMQTRGDERLLRVAIENLMNNAWKFTGKAAEAKIEVGRAKTGDKEAFYIRDNGVGFDMAYADKLFGAFQRLHTTEEFPGTGIGLAIVQRVIHKHGGRVWAEAKKGKGATFYFTL
jgi:PAS domain S-box-containing protein